ncbi:hypothetical protein GHT06_019362 [Daphnia sinensis]|uniref:Major facilitator superfamily associated domain-containing protein n=1 Tax=Daphnia sinensis TaxID=1820382 RepID=A0AAD5L2M0_9CRUS|nr:hypothetical protein GHT06_019362 [Daphnia sinensis]
MQKMDDDTEAVSEWKKLKKTLTVNKPLIPLKLTMLLYYGASSLYLPYLTLQMQQVGLNIQEIAIIYSVLPFVTCIMPPLAGMLADKFNRYKLVLILSVSLAVLFHTLLLHVDARISPENSPVRNVTEIPASVYCGRTGAVLRLGNESCSTSTTEKWLAYWTPSECQPVACTDYEHMRMRLCSPSGNCTQITNKSTSKLEVELVLETLLTDTKGIAGECTARILALRTDQTPLPSALLCNCLIQCPLTLMTSSTSNQEPVDDALSDEMKENDRLKHNRGFWMYFILRILASSSLATSFSMLDATAITMVKKNDGDLGKQRLFGVIGQAVFAMVAGILLDWTVELQGDPDYSILFYIADGLCVVVVLLVSRLDVDVERIESGNLMSGAKRLIRLIDVDFFILMMLLLGTCWGFLESFLFVFLMEMKANSYLLGMTVTLGCVIGVPFLYISDMIVRKIGSVNVFVIAFLIYCIRFFGYSLIWDPWLCLPFEALEAVTVHMMAVASSMYCAAAAPPGLLATLNGAVGSVHYSFGRGLGSFVGGILMSNFGTRNTFQIFGTAAGFSGLTYFILHRFYLVKIERLRLRRKSERIAEVIASGVEPEDEPEEEEFIIPPDNLLGRRKSCF